MLSPSRPLTQHATPLPPTHAHPASLSPSPAEFSSSTNSSSWDGTPHAEQLYDHAGDVGSSFDGPWERVNLAGQPAHKQDQEALAQVLEAFFKPAQDPSFGL